ncbi:sensor histidine kinase [Goekera deserti]|nr:HAMP domain-containing sensor histidine kinase [Goekera deserti]
MPGGDGRTGSTAVHRFPASRVPLRVTLVALVVTMVGFALVATGLGATALLRTYLTEQQDVKLSTAVQGQLNDVGRTLLACDNASILQYTSGTYFACVRNNGTLQEIVPANYDAGQLPELSGITPATIDQYAGSPFTVRSIDGTRQWRVMVGQLTGSTTIIAATDLAEDRDVLARLVALEVVVGLVVLISLGVAGTLLVRTSLRPLVEVEHTARAIADGDLSRRVPTGDERTEVGRLSNALNGMLTRIESSFQAQRASEEQARASEEQARASETRMRRFIADASHELRTPLTSIRGFAELHRHGAATSAEETARMMQRIESEAARMGMLVEDLLQLARLDRQRELSVLPVDLAELGGDAVQDARAVQPDRPISLVLDPSLTDDPVVLGDEARLRQVIGNLVANALAHTPVEAAVRIVLSEPADDPDVVVVSVADEGPGMEPADAERVFERFYRADASRTRAVGGSGLGLSIVDALTRAHGGSVSLSTAPGRGARFDVRLPRSGPPGDPVGPPVEGPA